MPCEPSLHFGLGCKQEIILLVKGSRWSPPHLKKLHPYFTQVQFEMAASKAEWSDFVVFIQPSEDEESVRQNLFVERIPFSDYFWALKLLPALQNFSTFLVQEFLTRCVRRGVPLLPSST